MHDAGCRYGSARGLLIPVHLQVMQREQNVLLDVKCMTSPSCATAMHYCTYCTGSLQGRILLSFGS